MNIQQIKSELRRLRKVKKDLRKGTDEYKEIRKKIKLLKNTKADLQETNPEKNKLIKQINSLTPTYLRDIIDLRVYSVEQLQFHLNKLEIKNEKH